MSHSSFPRFRYAALFAAAVFGGAGPALAGFAPTWSARFNGPINSGDRGEDLVVAADGSVYVVGWAGYQITPELQGVELTLLKYSADGTQSWAQALNTGSIGSRGSHVAIAPDGNIVTAGALAFSDPLVVKWTPDGTPLWTYGVATFDGAFVQPYDVAIAPNGDVLVLTRSGDFDHVRLTRVSSSGGLVWEREYTAPGAEASSATALALDGDHTIYLGGAIALPGGDQEFAVWKLSSAGDVAWVRVTGDPLLPGALDGARDVAVDADGNVIAVGQYRYETVAGADVAVLKYAPDGTLLWESIHSRPDAGWDVGERVALDANGDILVAVSYGVSSAGGPVDPDAGCLKLHADGTVAWALDFGSSATDYVDDLTLGADGSAYVVGTYALNTAQEGTLVARIRPDGALAWLDSQHGQFGGNAYAVAVAPDGAIYATGEAFFSGVNNDVFTLRYDDAATLVGDLNCDGVVSVSDVGPFVLALTDPASYATQFAGCDPLSADCSGDGFVSVADIGCMVGLLTGS